MPKWLGPWLVPAALVVAVVVAVAAQAAGPLGSGLIYLAFVVIVAIPVIRLRLNYLKQKPDQELTHKPFWRKSIS